MKAIRSRTIALKSCRIAGVSQGQNSTPGVGGVDATSFRNFPHPRGDEGGFVQPVIRSDRCGNSEILVTAGCHLKGFKDVRRELEVVAVARDWRDLDGACWHGAYGKFSFSKEFVGIDMCHEPKKTPNTYIYHIYIYIYTHIYVCTKVDVQ